MTSQSFDYGILEHLQFQRLHPWAAGDTQKTAAQKKLENRHQAHCTAVARISGSFSEAGPSRGDLFAKEE